MSLDEFVDIIWEELCSDVMVDDGNLYFCVNDIVVAYPCTEEGMVEALREVIRREV